VSFFIIVQKKKKKKKKKNNNNNNNNNNNKVTLRTLEVNSRGQKQTIDQLLICTVNI
jgi:predicted RNA-binding protein with EMAP domain